jgi:zinc/manganese transport system substrate-binding protein/manganese/iron transport system substrate-binding protein
LPSPRITLRHNLIRWRLTAAACLALALVVPGTAAAQTSAPSPSDPVQVVATTTVLADLVAQTGGALVSVSSLVPRGGEVHTFDPSPEDAFRLADADLIVMNGLGLDEWLRELIDVAGASSTPVIELAEDLPGVTYLASEAQGEEPHPGESPHADGTNPHLWLNVAYAQLYVDRIRDALAMVDPEHSADYAASSATYRDRLGVLDSEIRNQLAAIPAERRRVVSYHEAFPYFAAAYGLEIVSTLIQNPGQEPSAADLAALIEQIRAVGVSAIFAEGQFPEDLATTIAAEAGIPVVSGLHSDSVGDPPADTYEGMMRENHRLVVEALA